MEMRKKKPSVTVIVQSYWVSACFCHISSMFVILPTVYVVSLFAYDIYRKWLILKDRDSPDSGRKQKEMSPVRTTCQVPLETGKVRELRLNQQQQETVIVERDKKSSTCQPPPPPPPPPPPMPVDEDDATHKMNSPLPNGNVSPPSCPTPDYDTLSTRSSSSYSPTPSLTSAKTNSAPSSKSARTNPVDQRGESKVPDSVEMESLESFKLNNPALPDPKPPSTYFPSTKTRKDSQTSSSSSTPLSSKDSSLKRASPKIRPVSVTIGEYPSGAERKMPSRFNFLSASTADVGRTSINPAGGNDPITSQLQSELVQTLSRSNLKKRTERQENANGPTETSAGTVIIPVNSQRTAKISPTPPDAAPASPTNPVGNVQLNQVPSKKPTVTSISKLGNVFQTLPDTKSHISPSAKPAIRDAAEKIANTFANNNRLTIKVANGTAASKQKETVIDLKTNKNSSENTVQPNGILKNGTNLAWQNGKQSHATIVHQKSITFGKKTTIISDMAVSEN